MGSYRWWFAVVVSVATLSISFSSNSTAAQTVPGESGAARRRRIQQGARRDAAQSPPAQHRQMTQAPESPTYADYARREEASVHVARGGGMRPLLRGTRIYAGFRVGAGGKLSGGSDGETSSLDLKATPGFQTGAGYVWRYIGILGELRVSRFRSKEIGRGFDLTATAVDVVVKPRGGYQFEGIPLEVYGALPFGPSIASASPIDLDPGFTVGIVAGATYLFTDRIGVNAELGWISHRYGTDDVTLSFNQFSPLIVNFMLAL